MAVIVAISMSEVKWQIAKMANCHMKSPPNASQPQQQK
jgi:hypothetical protein